jgi:uncharacterized protein YidB (DUF937 family)
MSTLGEVSKLFANASGDGEHQNLTAEAVRMLTSGQGEGLNAIKQTFERFGMGHIISSWIGNGENAPISPDQVETVLGSGRVAELAKKVGISPETATLYLSKTLPKLVDALTPKGQTGSANDLLSRGKEILDALIAKKPGV